MWSGCRQADAVVSQAYSGYAEICPGFPPPQTVLAITASGSGTLGRMVQWWRVASCKYVKGRDNLSDGNTVNMLR